MERYVETTKEGLKDGVKVQLGYKKDSKRRRDAE